MGWLCVEAPGQKLVDSVDGTIGDALEHMAQVEFRIDALQFGGAEQTVDRSRTLSIGIGTSKQKVLVVMAILA